jgi:hypothetical protein
MSTTPPWPRLPGRSHSKRFGEPSLTEGYYHMPNRGKEREKGRDRAPAAAPRCRPVPRRSSRPDRDRPGPRCGRRSQSPCCCPARRRGIVAGSPPDVSPVCTCWSRWCVAVGSGCGYARRRRWGSRPGGSDPGPPACRLRAGAFLVDAAGGAPPLQRRRRHRARCRRGLQRLPGRCQRLPAPRQALPVTFRSLGGRPSTLAGDLPTVAGDLPKLAGAVGIACRRPSVGCRAPSERRRVAGKGSHPRRQR